VTTLIEVKGLTMRFGGITAVHDLSFEAAKDQITAVIGPNGAGKTTLFNCLTGFYKPTHGTVRLFSDKTYQLHRMHDFQIARDAKVVRTFQTTRLFPGMSALENLLVAQHTALMRASQFAVAGLLGLKSFRAAEKEARDRAAYWLKKVGLLQCADDAAGSLAYGAQRRLEIARACATKPILLCLDEPAAGLNPHESQELNTLLLDLRDNEKISLLLIEHDMHVVMAISDHVVVLDHGTCIARGTPDQVRADPNVIRAYLGVADEDAA
jgi:branched-chain amino acid transport system ATP-binding protein